MARLSTSIAALASLTLSMSIVAGCATDENELQRAADHYAQNQDDATIALLRAIEPDWTSLSARDRARYAFLRGVTDYREGYRADARHWLAIAAQVDVDAPGSLVPGEKLSVTEKLAELNAIVWAGDVLPNDGVAAAPAPAAAPKKKAKPAPSDDDATPKPADSGAAAPTE